MLRAVVYVGARLIYAVSLERPNVSALFHSLVRRVGLVAMSSPLGRDALPCPACRAVDGTPTGTPTRNTRFRKPLLYAVELWVR